MSGEFPGANIEKESIQIDADFVVKLAQEQFGLELDKAESEKILREVKLIFDSQSAAHKSTTLPEVLREKLSKIKDSKESAAGFVVAYTDAANLYARFGTAQEGIFHSLNKVNPNASKAYFEEFLRRQHITHVKNGTEYLTYLAGEFQKIITKFGEPFPVGKVVTVTDVNGKTVEGKLSAVTSSGKLHIRIKQENTGASDIESEQTKVKWTQKAFAVDSVTVKKEEDLSNGKPAKKRRKIKFV